MLQKAAASVRHHAKIKYELDAPYLEVSDKVKSVMVTIRIILFDRSCIATFVNAPLDWTLSKREKGVYVRLRRGVSDSAIRSTDAPLGTVVSPLLFSLYNTDFR